MTYLTRVLCVVFVFGLGLSACSDDSGSAQAPATPAASAPAAAPAAEDSSSELSSVLDGVEKADGVVYQDEIYANWPYN